MKIPAAIKMRQGKERKTVNPNLLHKEKELRGLCVDEEMKRNGKIFMLASLREPATTRPTMNVGACFVPSDMASSSININNNNNSECRDFCISGKISGTAGRKAFSPNYFYCHSLWNFSGVFASSLSAISSTCRRGSSSSGIIQELYGWKFKFHGSLIIHLSFSYLITFIQKFNSPCWWSALGVGNWTRPRWRGLIMSETKPIFGSWEVFGWGIVCSLRLLSYFNIFDIGDSTQQELLRPSSSFIFFLSPSQNSSIFTYIQIASAPSSAMSEEEKNIFSYVYRSFLRSLVRQLLAPLLMFILCSIYSSAIPEEIKKIFAFVCRNARKKIELGMKNVIAGRTVDVIKKSPISSVRKHMAHGNHFCDWNNQAKHGKFTWWSLGSPLGRINFTFVNCFINSMICGCITVRSPHSHRKFIYFQDFNQPKRMRETLNFIKAIHPRQTSNSTSPHRCCWCLSNQQTEAQNVFCCCEAFPHWKMCNFLCYIV